MPFLTAHGFAHKIWLMMLALTGIFLFLYLWFTLFPGEIRAEALHYFPAEELQEARRYVFGPRLVFILGFVAELGFLLWFIGSGRAGALTARLYEFTGMGIWQARILFFLTLWLILQLINLPFSLFTSYFWQHYWGFSTQTLGAWWQDYFLQNGLSLVLTLAGVLLLFSAMELWPRKWWLAGAIFSVCWIIIQTFLWPLVVSPLFNKFEPVKEPTVLEMVEELSLKTGLVIDEVFSMDASRRTTASNAYFTGLGGTKRIVLYDTLLKECSLPEVKAVLAHEMAHWQHAHILKGITWGSLGVFLFWAMLYLFLGSVWGPKGAYPPDILVCLVLFLLVVNFLSSPITNYFSRQMEREADRTAVILTADLPAAVNLQVNLATKNRSDVSPPPFLEWFAYSHPPTLKRIEAFKITIKAN